MALATAVGVTLVLFYLASLGWLLRREARDVWLGLATICALSLALRLLHVTDLPPGLDEHEGRLLEGYKLAYESAHPFGVAYDQPVLMNGALSVPLIPHLDLFWAVRLAPLLLSVLASGAAFAAARNMGATVSSAFASAALVAVLPWANFYGRLSLGGEMVFHQLLLVAALSFLVFRIGRLPELLIGGVALGLLLYDYHCGKAMLYLPLIGAALARSRRAFLTCLGVPVLALLLYAPYLWYSSHSSAALLGIASFRGIEVAGLYENPISVLADKASRTLRAFVEPVAADAFFTIRAAAMHPPLALVLAGFGMVAGLRRGLLLMAGFLGGLVPAVIGEGYAASTHRMLMAFPFLALSAGIAFDFLRGFRFAPVVVAFSVLVICVQSVHLYFSNQFWPASSLGCFDGAKTALSRALPRGPGQRVIVMDQLDYFARVRLTLPGREILDAANWLPGGEQPLTYAFTQEAAPLRPFYTRLFGESAVTPFEDAFLVTLVPRSWKNLDGHGWLYRMECDDQRREATVPTLFHAGFSFRDVACGQSRLHTWRGRWLGPSSRLSLRFIGAVTVEAGEIELSQQNNDAHRRLEFPVQPGDLITVRLRSHGSPRIGLFEQGPIVERVPAWEQVAPADW